MCSSRSSPIERCITGAAVFSKFVWLVFVSFLFVCVHGLDWRTNFPNRVAQLTIPLTGKTGFMPLDPGNLGIQFTNRLSDELLGRNSNLINGSGVALGDVDGDGWCDIFFGRIEGGNVLYRNLGNWKF